jgi:hypothetical protein
MSSWSGQELYIFTLIVVKNHTKILLFTKTRVSEMTSSVTCEIWEPKMFLTGDVREKQGTHFTLYGLSLLGVTIV